MQLGLIRGDNLRMDIASSYYKRWIASYLPHNSYIRFVMISPSTWPFSMNKRKIGKATSVSQNEPLLSYYHTKF